MHGKDNQPLILKMRFSCDIVQRSLARPVCSIGDRDTFHTCDTACGTAHADKFAGLGGGIEERKCGLEEIQRAENVDGDVVLEI